MCSLLALWGSLPTKWRAAFNLKGNILSFTQWREYVIYSHWPFQDISRTEIVLEEGTISYGVIPLGSKQTDIIFKIIVGCAVPTDQEEVVSLLIYCSSVALVQTRGVSWLSLVSPDEMCHSMSASELIPSLTKALSICRVFCISFYRQPNNRCSWISLFCNLRIATRWHVQLAY